MSGYVVELKGPESTPMTITDSYFVYPKARGDKSLVVGNNGQVILDHLFITDKDHFIAKAYIRYADTKRLVRRVKWQGQYYWKRLKRLW